MVSLDLHLSLLEVLLGRPQALLGVGFTGGSDSLDNSLDDSLETDISSGHIGIPSSWGMLLDAFFILLLIQRNLSLIISRVI